MHRDPCLAGVRGDHITVRVADAAVADLDQGNQNEALSRNSRRLAVASGQPSSFRFDQADDKSSNRRDATQTATIRQSRRRWGVRVPIRSGGASAVDAAQPGGGGDHDPGARGLVYRVV